MMHCLLLVLFATIVNSKHFNGGTIRWMPTNPYDNGSSLTVTIIQSYYWTFPNIKCTNPVPISTAGRSNENTNLTCVTDCSTDGGYSAKPIDILTNCTSVNPSLGLLTSERSSNVTLTAGAHFHLAYEGTAWAPLNYPAKTGLQWSIVTLIDLRLRPDGFINTPPVASVVSPQFVTVNKTTQISILVSDANEGDDLRCRWSVFTSGYRKRKRSNEEESINQHAAGQNLQIVANNEEVLRVRNKRTCSSWHTTCKPGCDYGSECCCSSCDPALCRYSTCRSKSGCANRTFTSTTKFAGTTTIDTPGTLKSTSSYPIRQAIDECGGICYPGSVPTGTTLSNCVLTFTGLQPDTWYAVALQVEDFINATTTIPMSSVPVQFLIYVMPEPECLDIPTILPLSDCLEATVGVARSFNLSVLNSCDIETSNVTEILISPRVPGMQVGNLTQSPTNSSLFSATLIWTAQANQIGLQQLCMIAYTSEMIQSPEYCVTFTVTNSSGICQTTTMILTSTSTSAIPITTTTTSTGTTATVIATSTSAPTTSTTAPSATVTVANSRKDPNWGLIAGVASLALPLGLLTFCCLYRLIWGGTGKRRRHEPDEENREGYDPLTSSTERMLQTSTWDTSEQVPIEVPSKSFQVFNIQSKKNDLNGSRSDPNSGGSVLVAIYNKTNGKRTKNEPSLTSGEMSKPANAWSHPLNDEDDNGEVSFVRPMPSVHSLPSNALDMTRTKSSSDQSRPPNNGESIRMFSSPSSVSDQIGSHTLPSTSANNLNQNPNFVNQTPDFKDWMHLYVFGRK